MFQNHQDATQKKLDNITFYGMSYEEKSSSLGGRFFLHTDKISPVLLIRNKFVIFNILIFILLSTPTFYCKKDNQKPDLNKELTDPASESALEIQKNQEILKSEIKKSYKIQNSSSSVEEALQKALTEIRDNPNRSDELLRYSCSPEETRKIYLPNNADQNNITANSKIEDSMYLILLRRTAGLDKIRKHLQNTKGAIKIPPFPKPHNIRKLININGYIIGEFDLQVGSKTIRIEEIKLVIEHKNQFKVCTYGT
ncbi:hypothetical protein LEP1GSC193_2924 [Leptospira alstonii serovar Pingchang str. 80-412]|uniref:Uncharacterized protein n=3 Tax=Leptospira alstonii TaxID=28452 RepID=M6D0W9_9LEPT|nr:hypothetical protein LEP1GSC194_3240 [Leptospira alstonii serovar Sichuan str. 79601]EQA81714.1 hypothetical protein LEP1GSC193_2924 [Leptospira alstonii serovar Pingchang str. 80-412]